VIDQQTLSSLLKLMQTYRRVIDVNVGDQSDIRLNRASVLFYKCHDHVASTLYLLRGTNLPEVNVRFDDAATTNVTARAALECLFTFAFLFVLPEDFDEREMRYYSWVLSGLADRQEFPTNNPQYLKKLFEEKNTIESINETLLKNSRFLALSDKNRNAIMRGRWRLGLVNNEWRDIPWTKIGTDIGLNETRIRFLYGYLCSYAHSGGLSGIQLQHAMGTDEKSPPSWIAEMTIGVVLSYMIKLVCDIFSKSKIELKKDAEGDGLVQTYVGFGKLPMQS
jgi:hypothetical protein